MGRKALFFDIDGTLLSEVTGKVPESTKKAISIARSLGHLVFINTGRTCGGLGTLRGLVENDGWLCGCGTSVEAEGILLYKKSLSWEQIRKISRSLIASNMDGIFEGSEACYVLTLDSRFELGKRIRQNVMAAICCIDPDHIADMDVQKLCAIGDEKSHKDLFFSSLIPDMQVIQRGGGLYECVPVGHSKATAIDIILKEYRVTLNDAYVFGDSNNDIAMFEHVPNAVLMGKHSPQLEPYASFLTRAVEEDGIWYAMESLGLLSEEQ